MLIDPRDAGQPLQTREVWSRWAQSNPDEWEVARKFFLEMETYLPPNYYPNAEVETWELFPLDWDWIGVDMPYEFLTDQENYEELYVPRMKETLTEALLRVFRRGLAVRIEGTAMSLDELIKEDFWIESYQVAHLPLKKVTGKPRQDGLAGNGGHGQDARDDHRHVHLDADDEINTRPEVPGLGSPVASPEPANRMGEPDNALRDRGVLVDPPVPHLRTRPQDTITGVRARVSANIRALELAEQGGLTERDLEQVALFSGWGGLAEVFDETKPQWAAVRERLHDILGEEGYKAARRSTVNAHYTHNEYVTAIWDALKAAGVQSGAGLEPGCGIGHFIAHAPNNLTMTGIELDSTAARLAQLLAPSDTIRAEGFETTTLPPVFDVAVGNVPFADLALFDPAHNPGRHSMHNHFIIKSLDLLKPGGYAALITSTYTLDAKNPAARRDMYERADLVAAIRLPSGAHNAAAGTSVASDLLIFRKRTPGETPQEFTWEHTHPVRLPRKDGSTAIFALNNYFLDHPSSILALRNFGCRWVW